MRRASGVVLSYRESVHHQAVASWACLEALRANADWFLGRYLADARRVVADSATAPGALTGRRVVTQSPPAPPGKQHVGVAAVCGG